MTSLKGAERMGETNVAPLDLSTDVSEVRDLEFHVNLIFKN